MSREIERRVIRLERDRHTTTPDMVMSDNPEIPADALDNWRHYVASGRATVTGHVLCFNGPVLTEDEWAAWVREIEPAAVRQGSGVAEYEVQVVSCGRGSPMALN